MADRVRGITIEIGGDTSPLSKALSGINGDLKSTQTQLRDVERLLKLDHPACAAAAPSGAICYGYHPEA